MGTFYRTIRLVEHGMKPIYVFDGKPPNLKAGELDKRKEKREEAEKALAKAQEQGNLDSNEPNIHCQKKSEDIRNYVCTEFVHGKEN